MDFLLPAQSPLPIGFPNSQLDWLQVASLNSSNGTIGNTTSGSSDVTLMLFLTSFSATLEVVIECSVGAM